VVLTSADLERSFIDPRALVGVPTGSTRTVHTPVDLAVVISQAIERTVGEQ
jgi:hypothetical protein